MGRPLSHEAHKLHRTRKSGWRVKKEDVLWSIYTNADPDMSMPFSIEIIMLRDVEALQRVVDKDSNARSWTYDGLNENGVGATIIMSADFAWLSVIAHEVAHIALLYYAHTWPSQSRLGAKRWLADHPEHVAEMIGNYTSVIWDAVNNELQAES